jgi:hypothetical protein
VPLAQAAHPSEKLQLGASLASNKVIEIVNISVCKICANIGIKILSDEIINALFLKKVALWQKIGGIDT